MQLFSDNDLKSIFKDTSDKIESEIAAFSNQKIMTNDLEELVEYLYSAYQFEKIELYEDNINRGLKETKIRKANRFKDPNDPKFFNVDGYAVSFSVPFDGGAPLLNCSPSYVMLQQFPVKRIVAPRGEELGLIELEMSFDKDEIFRQDDINTFIDEAFKTKFRNYRTMIEHINSDVEEYNSNLRGFIRKALETRKQRAESFQFLNEKLNIPLTLRDNVPSVTPKPLKRIERKVNSKPISHKQLANEYAISDDDYYYILKIIHSLCTAMEAAAKTFEKNSEEELRDFIVATLNTHYEAQVTGETFRRIGKTDIHILAENKAAFIGECKIWHGIKKFEEAIDQLFNYSTWRDIKLSLIVFNKHNKNFKSIRKEIDTWVVARDKMYKKDTPSSWQCNLRRLERNDNVQLNISVYDFQTQ